MIRRTLALVAFFSMTFAAMAGLSGGAVAQDGTPSADGTAHPAHIHAGTCDTLGDVVFPLTDVSADQMGMMGTPHASMHMDDMMGTPHASMDRDRDRIIEQAMASSISTVDAPLDDILAAEHAINVHESAENIGNYIACGDITGEPVDGMLQIELAELNDSGYVGMAMLTDNGDGTTEVIVMLMEADAVATPAA